MLILRNENAISMMLLSNVCYENESEFRCQLLVVPPTVFLLVLLDVLKFLVEGTLVLFFMYLM